MFSQQQDNMEATALCTRLFMTVFLLLAAQVQNCCYSQKLDAAFPRTEPNRLQFFAYSPISVQCEHLDCSPECRVMKRLKKDSTNTTQLWETSTGSITVKLHSTSESGEYWCENKEGERSNSINITVTDGDVILESPALPVTEGEDLSLYCRTKTSNPPADFYKDGLSIATGYTGMFTINSVSKSHEGLYKCRISGVGESAESWLAVGAHITSSPKEIQESSETTDGSPQVSILLPVVITTVSVAVLLMLVGLLHCLKHKGCLSSDTTPGTDSGSREAAAAAAENMVTYAVVTKHRNRRAEPGISSSSARQISSAGASDVVYSTIQLRSPRAEAWA
ncbi:low affinity immunoglobulin gamma Fc region receptor II-b-like isoform X3 [Acanthopagrus latus]|uniref:low affinity immunoglobulin gamma Fc region receptor II-b-like isoform X3 n=1 Tax=Acanthopagrus latus TaxID=8177 RepID=UPI00187C24F1|nr:low affinity immunoglobulin gamma Fc region receptor II-b-like isoform X3 [Acanthopagrus latus]